MLHCPRCSGPLHVREDEQHVRQHANPQGPAKPACPAGSLCPHSSHNQLQQQPQQQQQQPQPQPPLIHFTPVTSTTMAATTSPGFLSSGGSVILASSSSTSPVAATGINSDGGRSTTTSSSSSSSAMSTGATPQILGQSLSSPLLNLNLIGLEAARQPHQQHQQHMFGAATAAAAATTMQHQLQQQQLQQQHLQQQIQSLQQQLIQQQFVAASAAHLTLPAGGGQLLLTSTVPQVSPLQSSTVPPQSTLCAPATPAIVVGSSGLPFFPAPSPATGAAAPAAAVPTPPPAPVISRSPSPPSAAALIEVLEINRQELEECGWYYAGLRWDKSAEILESCKPGAFLIRDSADSRFLYSLSVQRSPEEGPTSVRIHFQRGKFKLDADESIRDLMPSFRSVVSLIEHYLGITSTKEKAKNNQQHCRATAAAAATSSPSSCSSQKQVWVDSVGKISSPITLRSPKYKEAPSLAHFARLSIHRQLQHLGRDGTLSAAKLELPQKLKEYVASYPHRV